MLAAAQRLRRREDFTAVLRRGRRVGRGVLVTHLSVVIDESRFSTLPARAGFVVSKAVGNAVVRNRVRRRLRHLMRDRLAELPAGSSVVIRALPGAADRDYRALTKDLDAALAAARSGRTSRTGK